MKIELSDREHATVLAALRYWQRRVLDNGRLPREIEIADDGGLRRLSAEEVDELCKRINT